MNSSGMINMMSPIKWLIQYPAECLDGPYPFELHYNTRWAHLAPSKSCPRQDCKCKLLPVSRECQLFLTLYSQEWKRIPSFTKHIAPYLVTETELLCFGKDPTVSTTTLIRITYVLEFTIIRLHPPKFCLVFIGAKPVNQEYDGDEFFRLSLISAIHLASDIF